MSAVSRRGEPVLGDSFDDGGRRMGAEVVDVNVCEGHDVGEDGVGVEVDVGVLQVEWLEHGFGSHVVAVPAQMSQLVPFEM